MRKICVVTTTRAEYGLLYPLLKAITNDEDLQLQLIVSGSHLEKEFGYTATEVEKNFTINYKVPLNLTDDSTQGVANSMGLAQVSFTKAYADLNPDIIVLLGDRFEVFCAASAALISKLPMAHIHGGELTQGAYDDAFRHSITKMSHLHFTAAEEYKNRVIQMGEDPKKVFNVGALGIENIKTLKLLSKEEFEDSIDFKLNKKNILVTFHPETLSTLSSKEPFQELLNAIDSLQDTTVIFTYANSDTDGKIINQIIEEYTRQNKNCVSFSSLGQLRYLSSLQFMDGVVGNSSSGLLEAPSFKIGTINIGDRQKGRLKASSIIDCKATTKDIQEAFNTLYSKEFQKLLQNTKNPYGEGFTSEKIIKVIKNTDLSDIIKKSFWDIKHD